FALNRPDGHAPCPHRRAQSVPSGWRASQHAPNYQPCCAAAERVMPAPPRAKCQTQPTDQPQQPPALPDNSPPAPPPDDTPRGLARAGGPLALPGGWPSPQAARPAALALQWQTYSQPAVPAPPQQRWAARGKYSTGDETSHTARRARQPPPAHAR